LEFPDSAEVIDENADVIDVDPDDTDDEESPAIV
jgi:hypothetical protein